VIYFGADVRFPRNAQGFVDGFEKLVAFAAHVGDVHSIVLARDAAQRD
jgi:hypothetical protein